jgi:hypothetical protein
MKDVQQGCYIINVELVSFAQISNLILNCAAHEKNLVDSAQIMYFVRVI